MSYTVFDRAGNKGSCRFTVRVRGELLIEVLEMKALLIIYVALDFSVKLYCMGYGKVIWY